jgi:hypothetical protein
MADFDHSVHLSTEDVRLGSLSHVVPEPSFVSLADTTPHAIILAPKVQLWEPLEVTRALRFTLLNGDETQANKVSSVVKEWELYANVKFERVEHGEESELRIMFGSTTAGSHSQVVILFNTSDFIFSELCILIGRKRCPDS